jgi:Domain of unknown function (DUF4279)
MPADREKPTGAISLFFGIGGKEFDPEALTQLLQLKPSEVWRQKNPRLKNRGDLAKIEWRYDLLRRRHWSIDDAIREILEIFSPCSEEIRAFASEHSCEVHLRLRLHADETVIVYEISAETMESLVALGCSLSFHID